MTLKIVNEQRSYRPNNLLEPELNKVICEFNKSRTMIKYNLLTENINTISLLKNQIQTHKKHITKKNILIIMIVVFLTSYNFLFIYKLLTDTILNKDPEKIIKIEPVHTTVNDKINNLKNILIIIMIAAFGLLVILYNFPSKN